MSLGHTDIRVVMVRNVVQVQVNKCVCAECLLRLPANVHRDAESPLTECLCLSLYLNQNKLTCWAFAHQASAD